MQVGDEPVVVGALGVLEGRHAAVGQREDPHPLDLPQAIEQSEELPPVGQRDLVARS